MFYLTSKVFMISLSSCQMTYSYNYYLCLGKADISNVIDLCSEKYDEIFEA